MVTLVQAYLVPLKASCLASKQSRLRLECAVNLIKGCLGLKKETGNIHLTV